MHSPGDERLRCMSVARDPARLLAFGFGAGCVPVAPGTFGTLVAVPVYLLLVRLGPTNYALAVLGLFAVGVWICGKVSTDLGVHDHSGIVWDEIVGYLVAMFMAPQGWPWVLAGFALFRLFDIWKPFPIRWLDRTSGGGFGIMIDDVLAGAYAAVALQVLGHLAG